MSTALDNSFVADNIVKRGQKSQVARWAGSAIVGLWLLLWSFFTLTFDGMIVYFTMKTWLARSYPTAPGEITASEVRHNVTENGNSYQANVQFRYVVDGQEYTGDQLNFLGFNESNEIKARRIAETYPAGRHVDVFYNPRIPSDSALDRTLNGLPLFMALFLMPFNLIMIGGWSWIARRASGISSLPLRREGRRWMILKTHGQPLMVAIIAAGVMSFLAILVVGLGGWSESGSAMTVIWILLLGLSGLAFTHTRSLILREPPLLVLDNDSQTVTWPASENTAERSVPRSSLLRSEIGPLGSERHGESSDDHAVSLKFTGDDGRPMTRFVLKARSGAEADALADWLDRWAAS